MSIRLSMDSPSVSRQVFKFSPSEVMQAPAASGSLLGWIEMPTLSNCCISFDCGKSTYSHLELISTARLLAGLI